MARSKSSKLWLKEHFDDAFVKRSQQMGYRSRAAFKLLEIADRDRLFKSGSVVLDLGAAPGGWSQVAVQRVGPKGRVIASDILPLDPIPGVEFIQGDFTEAPVFEALSLQIGTGGVDLVLSDMAPNMSGVKSVDQSASMLLCELAFDMAKAVLKPGGNLLVKAFHGEGLDPFQRSLRSAFQSVKVRKPDASRSRSSEIYLLAVGLMASE